MKKLSKLRKQGGKRPLEEASAPDYPAAVEKLRQKTDNWENFFDANAEEARNLQWDSLDKKQYFLCSKYAWAVPDERALRILGSFGPLIEIGSGKGLWASLLREKSIDIVAFDKFVDLSSCWTEVQRGDPEKLSKKIAAGRNLMLCYPDESTSMAAHCLDLFSGEYIIHIGELLITGTRCGLPTAPFGRTSSAERIVLLFGSGPIG